MTNYIMFGKYTSQSIKDASKDRTKDVVGWIKECGGEVKDMCALLSGEYDLMISVDMPGTKEAVKASAGLARRTGILFSTCPTVSVQEFDADCI